ncbi:hypothetical protein BKA57DRAFT_440302 [Linnemannia elongata]|nr:hypothetical protein BKA57DRAFT_440302 [Linnemannia elongata]KAK5799283.1 hypothetical protein F5H01DRAFT_326615 [Linnemannia elongata]
MDTKAWELSATSKPPNKPPFPSPENFLARTTPYCDHPAHTNKLVNFWVNKAVTESLLNSPKFHQFAAKTHHHVNNISKNAAPMISESTNRAAIFAKAFKETVIKESEAMSKKK